MKKSFFWGILFGILCMIIIYPIGANAYVTYNNHRLINGVGNYGRNTQYYYIDRGASGEAGRIRNAMNKWVNSNGTGAYTPISFRETTNKPASLIDVEKSGTNGSVGATTYFMIGGNSANASAQNWYWARINIWSRYNTATSFQKDVALGHEFGHAFGLDHETNRGRLMHPRGNETTVNGPTRNELDGITALYK